LRKSSRSRRHSRWPPEQEPATRGKRGSRSRLRRAGCGCGLNAWRCGTSACLLTPIAPHVNPAAKAPRLPLSPEKASVDRVVRSYSPTIRHSIGPRRNNTNETPGCSFVTQGANTNENFWWSSVRATPRTRTKRPRVPLANRVAVVSTALPRTHNVAARKTSFGGGFYALRRRFSSRCDGATLEVTRVAPFSQSRYSSAR
jgi:hypothetical protein